jgi:hypothetical protein
MNRFQRDAVLLFAARRLVGLHHPESKSVVAALSALSAFAGGFVVRGAGAAGLSPYQRPEIASVVAQLRENPRPE